MTIPYFPVVCDLQDVQETITTNSFLCVVLYNAGNLKDTWNPAWDQAPCVAKAKQLTFLSLSGPIQCTVYTSPADMGLPPLT